MPTIPIEESDYAAGSGALAGERVFKNTVPATTAREQTFNTIWHNLRKIITEMGVSNDLSAANYSADLAAGFPNLSKAVRRLARRSRYTELSLNFVSDSYLLTPQNDKYVYMLENDGGGPYGDGGSTIFINHLNNAQDSYRTILIYNNSGEAKLITDAINSANSVWLEDQEACLFTAIPQISPVTGDLYWVPLGKELHTPVVNYDVRLYNKNNHANFSSGSTLNYIVHGPGKSLVTLDFSGATITIATSDTSVIEVAPSVAFGNLPADLIPVHGAEVSPTECPFMLIYGMMSVGGLEIMHVSYENSIMRIRQWTNGNFGIGNIVTIYPFSWTFRKS